MGEVRGIDYAWARPDPAEIARRGYTFVCRYYSRDLSKSLSADEAKALDGAGLSIVTVFEDQANRATQGRDAGVQDGQWSAQLAEAAGQPAGTPIYVAVDYDALESDWAAIAIYLDGFREGSNHPVGIYGKDTLVERMMTDGHAVYGWQTVAWSNGNLDQQAHIYQRAEQDFGGDADINVALQPYFGGWRLTGTQPPPPVPAAAPPNPSAVIATAAAEVGYEGAPNEGSKYGDWYGMSNQPWCAMFVSWCFAQNGMGVRFSYCPDGVDEFKNAGRWFTTPQPGDVVFYDWDADGVASHTGLVEAVDADGTVHTIEGNRAMPGDDGNPEVARHTIPGEAAWSVVLGFGRPEYATPPSVSPPPPSGVVMDSETFVRWAYASFLFRDPDQQGLNTFIAYDQQHGHAACLTAILDSAEGQKRLAQMRHLLDSQPV